MRSEIYLIFERNDQLEKTAEKPFVTIRQLVLIRHLAAKLFEFNKITIKYFGAIKKPFPQKLKLYQARYLPVALRIRQYQWLDRLRNKMAFHFDEATYLDQFDSIEDKQELSMMVGAKHGETAFLFAEEIVSMPYFSKVGDGDIRRGLEQTAQFANRTSSEVLNFFATFYIGIAEQYGLLNKRRLYEASPDSIGTYGKDFIPVFTSDDMRIHARDIRGKPLDD